MSLYARFLDEREEGREEGRAEAKEEARFEKARALIRSSRQLGAADATIISILMKECEWDNEKAAAFLASFDQPIPNA